MHAERLDEVMKHSDPKVLAPAVQVGKIEQDGSEEEQGEGEE